jgi:peptidoglycan/LPS O-acetylase OafA/YrhL
MTTIGFGLTVMGKGEEDSRKMQNRVIELDIVRALAIFLILLRHLSQHTFNFYAVHFKGHLIDLTFVYWGELYFGLGLFAFISGYLLTRENPCFNR